MIFDGLNHPRMTVTYIADIETRHKIQIFLFLRTIEIGTFGFFDFNKSWTIGGLSCVFQEKLSITNHLTKVRSNVSRQGKKCLSHRERHFLDSIQFYNVYRTGFYYTKIVLYFFFTDCRLVDSLFFYAAKQYGFAVLF